MQLCGERWWPGGRWETWRERNGWPPWLQPGWLAGVGKCHIPLWIRSIIQGGSVSMLLPPLMITWIKSKVCKTWIRCGCGELERALPSILLGLETRLCQGGQEIMSMSPRDTTSFSSFKRGLFEFYSQSRNFRRVTAELAPAYQVNIEICVPQFDAATGLPAPLIDVHGLLWWGHWPPHLAQTCYSCAGASPFALLYPLLPTDYIHRLHLYSSLRQFHIVIEDDDDWSILILMLVARTMKKTIQ